ncbi:hypothetical protein EXE43_15995 [Halorubrum sp. SS5]|nr:hypothetical protein EXE43_15995 [Halorubrum sp. SS5]
MSDEEQGDEEDEQEEIQGASGNIPGSVRPNESNDSEEEQSDYEPAFAGVDSPDSSKAEKTEDTSEQPPAATALNELAQDESLTEVLTVALQEWREMQQIDRQREEAEYAFRKSIIWVGSLAFIIVILVAGALSFTGNLPGSSFAFILGTLFGSLATLLQTFLRNHQPNE